MYKHSKRPPRGGYQLSGPKPRTGNEPYSTISNGPSADTKARKARKGKRDGTDTSRFTKSKTV